MAATPLGGRSVSAAADSPDGGFDMTERSEGIDRYSTLVIPPAKEDS